MQERAGGQQNSGNQNNKEKQNIEKLLGAVIEKLGGICQVNTVVGEPVSAKDTTIIPISKVSLGFVAGGGEYATKGVAKGGAADAYGEPAFGGGSGGGLTVAPVGFLTSSGDGAMRYIPVCGQEPLEKLLDMTPGLLAKLEEVIQRPKADRENKPMML